MLTLLLQMDQRKRHTTLCLPLKTTAPSTTSSSLTLEMAPTETWIVVFDCRTVSNCLAVDNHSCFQFRAGSRSNCATKRDCHQQYPTLAVSRLFNLLTTMLFLESTLMRRELGSESLEKAPTVASETTPWRMLLKTACDSTESTEAGTSLETHSKTTAKMACMC